MKEKIIIEKTMSFVEEKLKGEGSGHDWWHVYRVYNNALHIAKEETDVNIFVVQLSALLHDISDWKFNGGNHLVGSTIAKEWLKSLYVDDRVIKQIEEIINDISFRGAKEKTQMKTKEGKIVQDADRLDAIGAIGIGRAFAYGGYIKREMYNPHIKPVIHETFEQYKKSEGTTINHFYEKLLLLKDLMNTESGKKRAEERHQFMKKFLEHFKEEWSGY